IVTGVQTCALPIWYCGGGHLKAKYMLNGASFTAVDLTYVPTTHLWWRIREASGTVYWETSPDGVTWTQQASVATSSIFSLAQLNVELYAESFSVGNSSPGTGKFANLN